MSQRTLFVLWVIFWILTILQDVSDSDVKTVPVRDLLGSQQNESWALGNLTFGLQSPVQRRLENLFHSPYLMSSSPVFYRNVTGFLEGTWHNVNVTQDLATLPPSIPKWNETLAKELRGEFTFERSGRLSMSMNTNKSAVDGVNFVQGVIRLKDATTLWGTSGLMISYLGLHFANNGSLFAEGIVNGYDIYFPNIAKMMLDPGLMNQSVIALRAKLDEYMGRWRERLKEDPEDEQEIRMLTASPYCQCNFSIYAQFDPVDSSYSQSEVDIIESEIRNPTGIPYRSPPHFKASIKIFSQNCGVLLSSFAEDPTPPAPSATPVFDVTGLASPALTIKSQHLAFIAFIFCIGELITTINQISHNSNTQSSLSKLSEWSIGMMIITDAYWCLLGLTLGVADSNLFYAFASFGFVKFCSFALFQMQYLLSILRAQRRSDDEQVIARLYAKFYTLLVFGLIIFYNLAFKIPILLVVVGFILYSFWIPQIVRNVRRNARKPLLPSYIITHTLSRLFLPLYLFGCPYNIFFYGDIDGFGWGLWLFIAFFGAQMSVLLTQHYFGPRRFIPKSWLPQVYDYHPIIQPTDIESSSPVLFSAPTRLLPTSPDRAEHERSPSPSSSPRRSESPSRAAAREIANNQCAICFRSILPTLPISSRSSRGNKGKESAYRSHGNGSGNGSSSNDPTTPAEDANAQIDWDAARHRRMEYMFTPCQHLFHTECLERWMEVKMECPCCRQELPSL